MSITIVDFSTIADSYPSLCIPRVAINIDETIIRNTFDKLKFGRIYRVDIIIPRSDKNEQSKRVYIHFSKWFSNEEANSARSKFILGEELKIVYDFPWYWKVSANKVPQKIRTITTPIVKKNQNEDDILLRHGLTKYDKEDYYKRNGDNT
jgi:hypothetical protein